MASALYGKAPPIVQDAALSLYGWSLTRQRFGPLYYATLRQMAQRRTEDAQWLMAERDRELSRLLNLARDLTSHWRPHVPRSVTDDNAREVLSTLPFLTKEDLRQGGDAIAAIPASQALMANTGGTTGKSLQIRYRPSDIQRRFGILHGLEAEHGIDPKAARQATFSGRELLGAGPGGRPWRTNWSHNQRLYSSFGMTEEVMALMLDDLERWRPTIVNGFVSAIDRLARHALATGRRLSWRPRFITTTSESLLPSHRAAIEDAFGAPVRDQYGSAEGAPIAFECPMGTLHLCGLSGIVETVEVAGVRQSAVTSFTNTGTPLIRYLIGDVLTMAPSTCACGSLETAIVGVEGRVVDCLRAIDGSPVSVSHLSDVIKGIPNSVRRVKFVQDREDAITILVEADRSRFTEADAKKVERASRYRFGDGMVLDLRLVDELAVTAGGKFRMIENNLPPTGR